MKLDTEAIVVAVRAHGENGTIVRTLTPQDGVQAGYVRGGRSRRLRPVLIAGNIVQASYRARTDTQLPQLAIELVRSRASLHGEPLAAAAVEWSAALVAAALPEGQAYPRLHAALDGLLAAIEAAPSALGWGPSLVRFELLLLAELGYGLSLDRCIVSGSAADLVGVSPKSGGAVGGAAAEGYRDRLLALPAFLRGAAVAEWADIYAGLRLTGHFLARDILVERNADLLAARIRLVERLHRIAG